jgi:hypothetical protein
MDGRHFFNNTTLPDILTFDLDANGNLLLSGEDIFLDAELAGLFGRNM